MLKHTLQKSYLTIASQPLSIKVLFAVNLLLLLVIALGFFIQKPVVFSYSGSSCVKELTILPGLNHVSGQSAFSVQRTENIGIAGFDLISLRTCFTPTKTPTVGEHIVSVAPFGWEIGKRSFRVAVSEPPIPDSDVFSDPVPTARALAIPISQPDVVFRYELAIDGKSTDCQQQDSSLLCDISPFDLDQGKDYGVLLHRYFDDQKVETVVDQDMTTLVATTVKKTSIKNKQVIYSKPTELQIQFDKEVTDATATLYISKDGKKSELAVSKELADDRMNVTFDTELARGENYQLVVTDVEAKDGSTLTEPFKLSFSTSSGPNVSSISIGASKVNVSGTIVITFDQPIDQKQDLSKLVSIEGITSVITKDQKQVFLTYSNAGRCTDYKIAVDKGIVSNYAVKSDKSWSQSFRTICHAISTVGYSAEGRAIYAYTFGSGATTILYTGTIHGDESGARMLMYEWIDELEAHPDKLPSGRKIVVVPVINPDGVVANERYNSRDVDLNRNFDTDDWKKDVVTPANQPLPGGGGSSPMSEPETKAIASLTSSLRPRLTMSFHGAAGYAIGNLGGDSKQLAAKYSSLSGYSDQTGKSDTAFSYAITGTYDDWIREKLGLASVLIELTSNSSSEFWRNQAALWAMANA